MFNNFVGNKELLLKLQNVINKGRFPHAIILEGEKGLGKHTLANLIAMAAVCEDNAPPCENCRHCRLAINNAHTDIINYGPDGATFKVDTAREIRDNAIVMPIEAKRKVLILSSTALMNDSAQNALLKILEEPPAFTVFILLCDNSISLLPTIRSRCQTFTLTPPEKNEALEYLKRITDFDEQQISDTLDICGCNIGRTITALNNTDDGSIHNMVEDFTSALANRKRFDAVLSFAPLCKDREGFVSALKELSFFLSEEIRQTANGKYRFAPMQKLIKMQEVCENSLKYMLTNGSAELGVTTFIAEIFSIL